MYPCVFSRFTRDAFKVEFSPSNLQSPSSPSLQVFSGLYLRFYFLLHHLSFVSPLFPVLPAAVTAQGFAAALAACHGFFALTTNRDGY